MKENTTIQREKVLSEESIDRHFDNLNIKTTLSKEDYKQLSLGMQTGYLSEIRVHDKVYEGRIRSRYNDLKGKFEYNIDVKKFKLEIPEKELTTILKRKITASELAELHAGKKIGPFKNNSSEFFVAVDKDLNKITLHSSKYLGIPNSYAEYKFSPMEKQNLANGLSVGPKVFQLDKNTFVLGNFSINPSLSNYSQSLEIFKELNKNEARELAQKYNLPQNKQEESKLALIPGINQNKNIGLEPSGNTSKAIETIQNRYQIKNINQFRNNSFDYYHITSSRDDVKFNQMLKSTFNQDELQKLKDGKGVLKTITLPKNGKTFTSVYYLTENQNNTYTLYIDKPELAQNISHEKSLVMVDKPQYFNEQDKLVLNLVDKKNFKELNEIVKNGYKPSEDVERLIINSDKLTVNDKLTAAHILKFDEHKLISIHQNNLPNELKDHDPKLIQGNKTHETGLKVPSLNVDKGKDDKKKDKDDDKPQHKDHNKLKDGLNLLKNAFGDM